MFLFDILNEQWDQEPEQQGLPGIPSPQQHLTQTNLKQYGPTSWKANTVTSINGQDGRQARTTSIAKLSPRNNYIVTGQVGISSPNGKPAMVKWSVVISRSTGQIIAQDTTRLDDFATDAVYNHLTMNGLMKRVIVNPLIQSPTKVDEAAQDDQSVVDKEAPDTGGEQKHPRLCLLLFLITSHGITLKQLGVY